MKGKKKTFNVQPASAVDGLRRGERSTFNVQRGGRIREEPGAYFDREGNGGTSGARADGAGAKFDLEDRLLEFTARLIKLVDALPISRAGNHIAGQLLRCGTSPFANHGEVQAAESRKDFIHKLGVCFKELKEIKRWLRLIARVELLSASRVRPLLLETEELIRIFSASIRTAEKNSK
jgi:four helix bundle protein